MMLYFMGYGDLDHSKNKTVLSPWILWIYFLV